MPHTERSEGGRARSPASVAMAVSNASREMAPEIAMRTAFGARPVTRAYSSAERTRTPLRLGHAHEGGGAPAQRQAQPDEGHAGLPGKVEGPKVVDQDLQAVGEFGLHAGADLGRRHQSGRGAASGRRPGATGRRSRAARSAARPRPSRRGRSHSQSAGRPRWSWTPTRPARPARAPGREAMGCRFRRRNSSRPPGPAGHSGGRCRRSPAAA